MTPRWKRDWLRGKAPIRAFLVVLLCVSCGGGSGPTVPDDTDTIYQGSGFVGSIKTTCAEDITVNGDLLYIADGPGGLKVVDISDRANPALVRHIPSTYAIRVCIHENHLYLCDASAGFRVYSLAVPTDPDLTYSEDTEWATSAAFHNGYLYLGDYFEGFRIYRLDNPAKPEFVKKLTCCRVRDVCFDGNTLLISDVPYGLATCSLESPTDPHCAYAVQGNNANFEDVIGHNGYAILARNDDSSEMSVFRTANLSDVHLSVETHPARFIEGLTKHDNVLVVSCGEDGVIGYDISKLPALEKLWELNTPNYTRRAKSDGDYLYVADMSEVRIYKAQPKGGDST